MKNLIGIFLLIIISIYQPVMAQKYDQSNKQELAYWECLTKKTRSTSPTQEDFRFCKTEIGVPDNGKTSRENKLRKWGDCLTKQAITLDDGISPAKDIAEITINLCSSQYEEYVDSLWEPDFIKKNFLEEKSRYEISIPLATKCVLNARKQKKT